MVKYIPCLVLGNALLTITPFMLSPPAHAQDNYEILKWIVGRRFSWGARLGARGSRGGHPESVWQLLCRPSGTRLCATLLPSTHVPGFPLPPLRGWSDGGSTFLQWSKLRHRLVSLV
jgi:hypothetical protein